MLFLYGQKGQRPEADSLGQLANKQFLLLGDAHKTDMSKETDARVVIDRLLREVSWVKSQLSTEEPAADGRADYLLKDSCTRWTR